jgi:hypothetical protein
VVVVIVIVVDRDVNANVGRDPRRPMDDNPHHDRHDDCQEAAGS